MVLRMGNAGAFILWAPVCLTAFFVCQTALHAASRTVYAFSRDNGFPDAGYLGHVSQLTGTPLRAIWASVIVSILPVFLEFASPAAVNAVFSLTAIALDGSYIIPIALRRVFRNHPEVNFKPGPFYMGDGFLGWFVNVTAVTWVSFVIVIFSLPTLLPVTALNMNYAAPITAAVVLLSGFWYLIGGRKHYVGPVSNVHAGRELGVDSESDGVDEKMSQEKSADARV